MAILSLNDVKKAFGGQVVLDGVTFQVDPGDRIGLIGPNGSGKTTILRVIVGTETIDTGSITRSRGIHVGHLAQEPDFDDEHNVHEAALDAFKSLMSIEKRLKVLEKNLTTPQAVAEHGRLFEKFEHEGGYTYRKRTDEVLEGLSFRRSMFDRPVTALSGGEKSRVALARLLLSAPEIVMLDEATNHLDIEGTEWLETFLREYAGAVIITSHDRYFLDRVATRIVELERARVRCFPGNYSAYMTQKEELVKRQTRQYQQQQEFIAKEEKYIRRNIAAQNVAQARGRRRRLEKVERMDKPITHEEPVRLEFQPPVRSGDIPLRVNGLCKRYGELELFDGVSFEMERGDRLGIVGPNGAGKTTLLKIVLGTEEATAGSAELGHNVHPGYYSQQRNDLDPERNILEEMWTVRPDADSTPLRGYLGRFLFSGDDVFKRVGDLSGGEQARVALARLMLSGANFLVLDEPTNHLDIPSRTALESALLSFEGTILIVTHDRYLLNMVARKVLAIGHGGAHLYNVRFEHCEDRIREQFHPQPVAPPPTRKSRGKGAASRKGNRFRRVARSLDQIERLVIDKEEELEHVEWLLHDPELYRYPEQMKRLKFDHATVVDELKLLNAEWEIWADEAS